MTDRGSARFTGPFSPWELGLALRYLKARRKDGGVAMIAIISFLGIMLAVAVLISVMSIMNGFRAELLGRILGFNGHVYIQGEALARPDRDQMVRSLQDTPRVTLAAPLIESHTAVRVGGQLSGVIVRGVRPEDLPRMSLVASSLDQAAIDSFGAGEWGGDNVLIGRALAEQLGVGVGDVISLLSPTGGGTAFGSLGLEKAYTVGGIFQVGMNDYDRAFIYMPLEQAQIFFGKDGMWDVVEVMIDDPDQTRSVIPAIQEVAGPGGYITDWTTRNASFWEALQVERTAMRIILMLIVLIAAMNIISGIVMLVKNKGRDIAILRTIGAGRGAIMRVFFAAGTLIGVSGTIAGLILGVLFCTYIVPIQQLIERLTGARVFNPEVYMLAHVPARVEWGEVLFVAFWALFASCLATLLPARAASRLDPVEALRYE
ncbi:MAG: lipoprotein-releasing ABC transporter permease subunit [Brevundimonas sp.]|jgi:lipoprotein-releasing system permease protein|uniref:lipoprotein-releasing ABC transporter permease subunit n=1 Tax=Brevundimonas sp. TaxID=1871086 RepID=UPI00391BAC93